MNTPNHSHIVASVVGTAILLSSGFLSLGADTDSPPWRAASKKFTPVPRAADVILLPGERQGVTALELGSDLLFTFDASTGQILAKRGSREGSPQCVVRVADSVLLVQDKNRSPEVRSFSAADLREQSVMPLADFRLYRIASAAASRDGRYLWLSSSRTDSSLYGHINSALFRLDLKSRECKLVLGTPIEPVLGRRVPDLAQPLPTEDCWLISAAASGEVLVSDTRAKKILAFTGDATEPSKTIPIPFVPRVMPRECGRILPVAVAGRIAMVNLVEGKVTKVIEIKGNPLAACVSSDGRHAFFSLAGSNDILQIHLPAGSLLPAIDFSRTGGEHDVRDSGRGYDTFDISALRWADNPARLIGLGYDGYILMIAELAQDQRKQDQ
jgi:hypothetical protein